MKWLQCVCDICANVKYLFSAIRTSMLRDRTELPGWIGELPVEMGLEMLCSGAEKYVADCVQGKCADCGPQLVLEDLTCWTNDNVGERLQWKEWRKSPEVVKGKTVSRMKLDVVKGTRRDLVASLTTKLKNFSKHAFFARWQQSQYRKCMQSLPEDVVTTVVDFSENFTITQQEEAQSAYYSHTQVTIHPCVCTYSVDGVVIRDSVVFVSNELKHDAASVSTFINQLVEHIWFQKPDAKRLIVWSDGCASQYKSKQPFVNLAGKFEQKIDVEWHYFGSRHGKNASDGETGVIKTKMSRLLIANQVMVDSAEQFAKAAAEHLTHLDGTSWRHIYYVSSDAIGKTKERQLARKTIAGSRDIHAVRVAETGIVFSNAASCFCLRCRAGEPCVYGV